MYDIKVTTKKMQEWTSDIIYLKSKLWFKFKNYWSFPLQQFFLQERVMCFQHNYKE